MQEASESPEYEEQLKNGMDWINTRKRTKKWFVFDESSEKMYREAKIIWLIKLTLKKGSNFNGQSHKFNYKFT